MSKHTRYCYVLLRDLKKPRIRVYFEYDNTETDRRVFVERTDFPGVDAVKLAKKLKEKTGKIYHVVTEEEEIIYGLNHVSLKRYYLEDTYKIHIPEAMAVEILPGT